MNNEELADIIIERLNEIIKYPEVRADIQELMECRVNACPATCEHPTIQVAGETVGFLGLLNGIVGTVPDGEREGWGLISVLYDDANNLISFGRTDTRRHQKEA